MVYCSLQKFTRIPWQRAELACPLLIDYNYLSCLPMISSHLGFIVHCMNTENPAHAHEPTQIIHCLPLYTQRVPGHIGVANITVPGAHSNVQFQVSATVEVDETEDEGERSEITSDSTVFVPSPSTL